MPNDLSDNRQSDTEALLRPSTFVSEESFASDRRHRRSETVSKENNSSTGKRHLNLGVRFFLYLRYINSDSKNMFDLIAAK